jgi:hypothetical protein
LTSHPFLETREKLDSPSEVVKHGIFHVSTFETLISGHQSDAIDMWAKRSSPQSLSGSGSPIYTD